MKNLENPWKTLSTKTVYQNPWIRVEENQVITPCGKPNIYGVVHAKTATGVVAIDKDDNIFLVGQYRYPTESYSWEIIEGGADEGETALEAAKRELLEEAGLIAEKWEQLGLEIHLSNCFTSEKGVLFCASELTFVGAQPDDDEQLTIWRLPIDEALGMVDNGKITDAMSIIGLLRYHRLKRL
jgi:8-oxo-dGTP pyrophosphatase MutT (NUDIX family)